MFPPEAAAWEERVWCVRDGRIFRGLTDYRKYVNQGVRKYIMIHNDKQQMEAIGYNKRYLGEPGNAPFFSQATFLTRK